MRRYFTFLLIVFIIVIHPLFAQIKPITLCPGAGTTLTVPNTPSHSYQWQIQQVDSFSFVNLSNTAVYSGTSTNTLSISNTTTSMYGNKFRCLINDATGVVSGDTSALIFLSKWVGSSGTSWNTAANWDCGMVPDSITDAFIQSGNCIVNSNAFCRSLVLNPTATMQVLTGFSLTVANKATLNNELASNVRIVDSVVFKLNTDSAKLSQGVYEFYHATAAPTFSIN